MNEIKMGMLNGLLPETPLKASCDRFGGINNVISTIYLFRRGVTQN